MTVNSLVNFGVPGIARVAPLQPIMRNKFRIIFYKFGGTPDAYVVTQQVRNTTLPVICGEGSFNSRTIEITFLDDATNGCMRHVLAQCKLQLNKDYDAAFSMRIELLSGGGSVDGQSTLRTYSFGRCLIDMVQSRHLSYEDADALQFSVDINHETLEIFDAEMTKLW